MQPYRPLALLVGATLAFTALLGAPGPSQITPAQARLAVMGHAAPAARAEFRAPRNRKLRHFSTRRAMHHIHHLSVDLGVRVRTWGNERRAAKYMARKFSHYGYEVHIQTFSVDGRTSRNVVARWPGAIPYGLVIGGHMDSVRTSPGANDNASGVAVVLEMARIAAGTDQARFIKFVGFGSEEYGTDNTHHVGSEIYVRRLGPRGRSRLGGALSIDMVGDGRPLLVGYSGIADDVVARTVLKKVREAGIRARFHVLCDCSDHGPFEHAGIPGSFMYSGEDAEYHSSGDTIQNLQRRDVRRSGRAARAFVKTVKRRMIERFRRH